MNLFAPNIISRVERKRHVKSEFLGKAEFHFSVVPTIFHSVGAISLWLTLINIINEKVNWDDDFFIFCEDDHLFTKHYNFELLQQCITKAQNLDADILSGGVSWFKTGVQISKSLFWIEKFSGLQFTVIFKKFY